VKKKNDTNVVEKGHSSCCGVLKEGIDTQE
jgi:hypothetical protein